MLDLGCAVGWDFDDWVHGRIRQVAARLVGVDLDGALLKEMGDQSFDIVQGDVTSVRLDDTFDVVFAGELIEHVDNLRGLLDTASIHLGPGGRFVLTTPNAFAVSNFAYRLLGNWWLNSDHVLWFCEGTVTNLFTRHGWTIERLDYLTHEPFYGNRVRQTAVRLLRSVMPRRLRWNTLLVVARPPA